MYVNRPGSYKRAFRSSTTPHYIVYLTLIAQVLAVWQFLFFYELTKRSMRVES